MGIPAGSREPVRVPRERLVAAAETYRPGGTVGDVDAWMLAPAVVFEELVRRVAPDPERARVVLSSRLYRHLSEVVAGMQEYTAAEALYSLSSSGKYDLIVLDTPPSRNALAFLEAPRKLSMFLDERVLGLFLPGAEKRGFVYGGAAAVVRNVFTRVLGESFWAELQEFLERFSSMFDPMRQHAGSVRELLRSDQTAFVLVSSPEPGALREAAFFEEKLRELELPFEGTVLNRSWAYTRGLEHPSALGDSDVKLRVVEKMRPLAVQELARAERDRKLLGLLRDRQRGKPAVATPHLTTELDDWRASSRWRRTSSARAAISRDGRVRTQNVADKLAPLTRPASGTRRTLPTVVLVGDVTTR